MLLQGVDLTSATLNIPIEMNDMGYAMSAMHTSAIAGTSLPTPFGMDSSFHEFTNRGQQTQTMNAIPMGGIDAFLSKLNVPTVHSMHVIQQEMAVVTFYGGSILDLNRFFKFKI